VHVGLVGEHAAQCGADLLGRPLAAQTGLDDEPQRLQGMQLGPGALVNAALRGMSLGLNCGVALWASVALEFATEGSRREIASNNQPRAQLPESGFQ